VITPESCLPRSWSTSWLLGRPGREGQPQTPASGAELMTTPTTRYGRKLCSTPSWSAATACRPFNTAAPGQGCCPISTTGSL